MKDQKVVDELQRIASEHGGELRPVDVVKAARPKSSPLHSKFTWNDGEAAHEYRLWQAQRLIRVTVEFIGSAEDGANERVWVSLTTDRRNKSGGGYRTLVSVMSDKQKRDQLLADACAEMRHFEERYSALKELAEVFAAMRRVRKGAIAA